MNLGLLSWQIFFSGWNSSTAMLDVSDREERFRRLMLLSERESGLVWEEFSPRSQRCHAWGPYADRSTAERAKLRIRGFDVPAWAGRLETPGEGLGADASAAFTKEEYLLEIVFLRFGEYAVDALLRTMVDPWFIHFFRLP